MVTTACKSKSQRTLFQIRRTTSLAEFSRDHHECLRQFKVNDIRRALFDNCYPLEQREEAILNRLIVELTRLDNGSD